MQLRQHECVQVRRRMRVTRPLATRNSRRPRTRLMLAPPRSQNGRALHHDAKARLGPFARVLAVGALRHLLQPTALQTPRSALRAPTMTNDRDAHAVASQRLWMAKILSPVACAAQSPTEPPHLPLSTYLHRIEGIGRTKIVAPVLAASLSATNTPRSSARLRRTCAPTSNSMR